MRQLTLVAVAVAGVAMALCNPAPASAQANRTFVSGLGADGNSGANCPLSAPCRTFQAALAVTNPEGEIAVLDPANYGTVTITKAVSIVNDRVGIASITSSAGGSSAITIAAGASDVVNLRGLTVTGAGAGGNGIVFTDGAALNIQNCVIRGFTNAGISFAPTTSSTLTMLDTVVSNNAGTGAAVLLNPNGTGLTVNVDLRRVQVIGNAGHGIDATGANMGTGGSGTMTVTVTDSVVDGNGNSGMLLPTSSNNVTATLINTQLTNNSTGVATISGTAYLAESTILGNTTGFSITGSGAIKSFGNNRVTDTNDVGGNSFGSLPGILPQ
jgi:hypothetical protein